MTQSKDLVVGIDSSTTACKALAFDRQGRSIAEGRARLETSMPRPSWHEQSAQDWWTALGEALRAVTGQVDAGRLAAVCIAPQRETFVAVDAQGEPLRPAIVWMDERSRPLLSGIEQRLGAEWFHQETGKPLSGNLTVGKIAWLREQEPATYRRARRYLDVAGYLNYRLTGQYRTGWGCVDPMGMVDMRGQRWSPRILDYLGIEEGQLPEAFPPGTVVGEVQPEAAEFTGLPVGLPVVVGVGDGQSAGLGVKITHPGEAYLNLGTAVVSGAFSREYRTDRAFRSMYGGVPGTYVFETVLLGGAYTVRWFIDRFAEQLRIASSETWTEERFDAAIAHIPPGAQGLVLVPYWNSAMNPYWDAGASGIVVGWRGAHTLAHLYRAILEGIGYEQRLHTSGVEAALGEPVKRLIALGGGTRSRRWRQIIADITGKPVYQSGAGEAAALGAGILAALAVGFHSSVQAAAEVMSAVETVPLEPDPERHAFYSQVYEEVYRHLYPALQPYLSRLTEITENDLES